MPEDMNRLSAKVGFEIVDETKGLTDITQKITDINTASKKLATSFSNVEKALKQLSSLSKNADGEMVQSRKKTSQELNQIAQAEKAERIAQSKAELSHSITTDKKALESYKARYQKAKDLRTKDLEDTKTANKIAIQDNKTRNSKELIDFKISKDKEKTELRESISNKKQAEKEYSSWWKKELNTQDAYNKEYYNGLVSSAKNAYSQLSSNVNSLSSITKMGTDNSLNTRNQLGYAVANATLTVSGIRTVLNEFANISSEVVNIEKNAINIKRIMSDATEETLNTLTRTAIETAKSTDTQVTDVQEVQSAWVRINDTYSDNIDLLDRITDATAKFINVGDIEDAEYAVSLINASMLQFNMSVDEGIETLDKWAYMADKTALGTADEFGESVSKIGGYITSMGGNMNDAIVLTSILGDRLAKSGDEAGNSLKTITAYMNRDKTIKLFEDLDLDSEGLSRSLMKTETEFQEFGVIMDTVSKAYNDAMASGNEVVAKQIQNALGATRQGDSAIALLKNWAEDSEKYYGMIGEVAGTSYLDEQNEALMESFEAHWNSLKVSMVEFGVAFAESGLLDGLQSLMGGFGGLLESISALDPVALKFVTTLSTVSITLAGLKKISKMTGMYDSLNASFKYGTVAQRQNAEATAKTTAEYLKNELASKQMRQSTDAYINSSQKEKAVLEADIITLRQKMTAFDLLTQKYKAGEINAEQYANAISKLNVAEKLENAETQKGITLDSADAISKNASKMATDALSSSTGKLSKVQSLTNTTTSLFGGILAGLKSPMLWVTAGITALMTAYSSYKQKQEEATQNAKDSIEAYNQESDSLKEYAKEVEGLRSDLDSNTLSNEEAISARERLLEIQKDLIESYGLEAKGLDLLDGAIEKQIGLIKDLTIAKAGQLITENQTKYNEAEKAMNTSGSYTLSPAFEQNGEISKKINDIVKEFEDSGMKIQDAGTGFFEIVIDAKPEEAEKVIDDFASRIRDLKNETGDGSGFLDSILTSTSTKYNEVSKILDDNKKMYHQYMLMQTYDNEKTAESFIKYQDAIDGYNNALASGIGVEQAKFSMESARTEALALGDDFYYVTDAVETLDSSITSATDSVESIENAMEESANATLTLEESMEILTQTSTTLQNVKAEVEELGAVSLSTVQELMAQYPQLTDLLYEYLAGIASTEDVVNALQGVYDVDAQNFQQLMLNKYENNEEFWNSVMSGNSDMMNELAKQYGGDVKNWTTLAKSKADIEASLIKNLSSNWSQYFQSTANGLKAINGTASDVMFNLGNTQYYNAYKENSKAMVAIYDAKKKLDNLAVGSFKPTSSPTFSNASGKSNGSKAKEKDKQSEIDSIIKEYESSVESLQKRIVTALKAKYKELYDERVKYLEKERDAQIKTHNDRITQLQAEIDKIQGNTPEDKNNNLRLLKRQYGEWLQDDSTLGKSKQKELLDQVSELEKEINIDTLEAEIKSEQQIIEDINTKFDDMLDENSIYFDQSLKDFNNKMSEQRLYQEANALISQGKQQEIVDLLTAYDPDWSGIGTVMGKTAGQIIGEEVALALSNYKDLIAGNFNVESESSSGDYSSGSDYSGGSSGGYGGSSSGGGSSSSTPKTKNVTMYEYKVYNGKGSLLTTSVNKDKQTASSTALRSKNSYAQLYEKDKIRNAYYANPYVGAVRQYTTVVPFKTGGYTGDNEGIAYLHRKERVLTDRQTNAFDDLVYDFMPKISDELSSSNVGSSVVNNNTTFNKELVSVNIDKVVNNTPYDVENEHDNLNRVFKKSLQKAGLKSNL